MFSKFVRAAFLFSIVAVSAAFGAFAEAKTVFVHPPTADGADTALRSSLHELLKAAVSEQPGFSLTGNEAQSDLQLQPRLMKLGGSFIVTIDKKSGDKLLFTTKMKAANADELDNVSNRIVRSVLQEAKAEENAQVGDVTEDETTRQTKRIQTTRQWKVGFGPAFGDQMNVDKSGFFFALGFVWGVDPNFDLDLTLRTARFEKSGQSGASYLDFAVGTNYYLTRSRNALYLTGSFGRGAATVSVPNSTTLITFSDDTLSGWTARAGVGYKFFRTSTVNLGVEAAYSKMFGESSRSKSSPGITSLEVALYY